MNGPASSSQALKVLETRLAEATQLHDFAKKESTKVAEAELAAYKKVEALRREIRSLKDTAVEPIITEHALLRYLERAKGVNLDDLKREILDETTKSSIMFAGSGKVHKAGLSIVFRNKTVITVEKA